MDLWGCHSFCANFLQVSTLPPVHVCLASPAAQPSVVLLPFAIQSTPHRRRPSSVFSDVVLILSRRSYLSSSTCHLLFCLLPACHRHPPAPRMRLQPLHCNGERNRGCDGAQEVLQHTLSSYSLPRSEEEQKSAKKNLLANFRGGS